MEEHTVRVLDDGGDGATFMRQGDTLLPKGDVNAFPLLPDVDIRADDVIIQAYPKSGTHWVSEMCHMLLSHSLSTNTSLKIHTMLESTCQSQYLHLPSPRILNTHLPLHHLPRDVINKHPRIILLLRNPRDVAVSYYNFLRILPFCDYHGKWENFYRPYFLGKFCYGSWFEHTLHWEEVKKNHPELAILTLYYEDLKQDPVVEAMKICRFLDIQRTQTFVSDVCTRCGFDAMKKQRPPEEGFFAFRKGQVGDWKNWFTVAQNEWFDQLYQKKMKNTTLTFRHSAE